MRIQTNTAKTPQQTNKQQSILPPKFLSGGISEGPSLFSQGEGGTKELNHVLTMGGGGVLIIARKPEPPIHLLHLFSFSFNHGLWDREQDFTNSRSFIFSVHEGNTGGLSNRKQEKSERKKERKTSLQFYGKL